MGGVSKHEAVARLLKFLNARQEDTIAFGDSNRDISLFEASAMGVAMGDASDDLKEIADLVTESVAEAGLAKLEKRVLADDNSFLTAKDREALKQLDSSSRRKALALLWAYLGRIDLGDASLDAGKKKKSSQQLF